MKVLHICLSCFYIDGFNYQENMLPRMHAEQGNEVAILASTETFKKNGEAVIARTAFICGRTKFYRSGIDKYSYVGRNCFVESTSIGKYSSISNECYIGGASHPLTAVCTSPVFHMGDNVLGKNFSRFPCELFTETTIENDVWIGEGVKIKAA